jgi:hypothetical protein
MMVIAMMIAATIQPAAIHTPPSNSQRIFRSIDTGCMVPLLRSILKVKDSKEEAAPEWPRTHFPKFVHDLGTRLPRTSESEL